MINGGRDIFLDQHCDCTLALGGGSVIDTAKAIGMLAVNGGNVEDYQMNGKQVTAVPPLFIAVSPPPAQEPRQLRQALCSTTTTV